MTPVEQRLLLVSALAVLILTEVVWHKHLAHRGPAMGRIAAVLAALALTVGLHVLPAAGSTTCRLVNVIAPRIIARQGLVVGAHLKATHGYWRRICE